MTDIVFKAKGGVEYYAGDAPDAVLKWYAKEARNPALREAAQAELVARASGPEDLERKAIEAEGTEAPEPPSKPRPQAPPPKPKTELARVEPRAIVERPFSEPAKANAALLELSKTCHLVTPEPTVASIPEGFELGMALVVVDPARETYDVGGNNPRALDRVALQRIGSAAGVTWISSRQVDDRTDPHYCEWQVWARVRMLDGQFRDVPGSVTIDLREGIGSDWEPMKDKPKQIAIARKFIRRMAESKAMNRAIGNMGVRRSYTAADLQKPFATVRLVFTGRTEDPELRKEFAKMRAQTFLMGSSAAWGPPPELPAAAPDEPIPPELQGPTDEELPE